MQSHAFGMPVVYVNWKPVADKRIGCRYSHQMRMPTLCRSIGCLVLSGFLT